MKHQRAKRITAWGMLGFVIVSAPFAHLLFARSEPQYLLFLSELALAYPSVLAIWFAEEGSDG